SLGVASGRVLSASEESWLRRLLLVATASRPCYPVSRRSCLARPTAPGARGTGGQEQEPKAPGGEAGVGRRLGAITWLKILRESGVKLDVFLSFWTAGKSDQSGTGQVA